jgi:LPXTG-site transpeptidase (sortase) family protein
MNKVFERIWANKVSFLGFFFLIFTVTYLLLVAIDFVPEEPNDDLSTVKSGSEAIGQIDDTLETKTQETSKPDEALLGNQEVVFPNQISIPKLDKNITVLNPTSRSIAKLDEALLGGVVRHPDSATLEQEGNVFILGHSSYLPRVFNKNFQAFNGIQNLEWGDTITLTSNAVIYTYRVEKVYKARASDVTVPIADTGQMLTIATCNSFGSTDDRYIVEATLQATESA